MLPLFASAAAIPNDTRRDPRAQDAPGRSTSLPVLYTAASSQHSPRITQPQQRNEIAICRP